MHPRTQVPEELLETASFQGGLVTYRQALAAGLTRGSVRGLLDRNTWTAVDKGVYVTRPGEPTWLDLAWAGVLIGGPGSGVGGAAAAHLWGIGDPVDQIDIWSPRTALAVRDDRWVFRRGVRKVIGSPPRTSLEETVLDLCAGADADVQSGWISAALRSNRSTAQRMSRALDRATRLKGRRQVAELLQAVSGGSESPLEVRYLRDVERAHDLPAGTRQRSMSSRTRSDVVYEAYSLIVELDGLLGHRGDGERRDAWRDALHLTMGLVTLRFGWSDLVQHPCEVAAAVAEVLYSRGWQGSAKPCSNCRRRVA